MAVVWMGKKRAAVYAAPFSLPTGRLRAQVLRAAAFLRNLPVNRPARGEKRKELKTYA